MVIGICEINLWLQSVHSLKEKRSVLKPLLIRLRQKYNISVAELDGQDKWQSSTVVVACVSGSAACAHRLLEQVLSFIEKDGNVQVTKSAKQII